MGYLTLTRREGDLITLTIDPAVNTEKLVQHLLRDGINIYVGEMHNGVVRVGVEAPKEILVRRGEIEAGATTSALSRESH